MTMTILEDIDAAWRDAQRTHLAAFDPALWDRMASDYRTKTEAAEYNQDFLRLAAIELGWSVLDVGCGSGTFAIPLARDGHEVCGLDFSRAMLDELDAQAQREGIAERIRTVHGSWDDDWQTLGILPQSADIVIASRSFLTLNLSAALQKLHASARFRVCLSIGAEAFPSAGPDPAIARAIGRPVPPFGEYLYVLDALYLLGIKASVSFFGQPRRDLFRTREEAHAKALSTLGNLTSEEEVRLERYLDEHLVPYDYNGEQVLAKDYVRDMRWAHISWNKQLPPAEDHLLRQKRRNNVEHLCA
ncbi:MAG: class I SAM-dependent methyltransferase [Coriobacteriia bacterium]